MSQQEFAQSLGYERGTYKNWEYGLSNPPPDVVEKLNTLGLKPETKGGVSSVLLQDLDRPMIPVGFPLVKMRFAGNVPTSEDWGDPLSSTEFIELDVKYEHQKRFVAKVVGTSCWPALQQGDITVWHHDNDPPYGLIVLAQRKEDHGCTVKQLVWDNAEKRPVLKPVNPDCASPQDGEGWGIVARLVAVIRKTDGPERTWYLAEGIRADHLV